MGALAMGQNLPAPPAATGELTPALARISEAALKALAALWTTETEARHLRRQIADIQQGSELSGVLFKERERNLQLRKRDVMLTEKVAAAKTEMNVLKEREAEFAMAQVESRSELLEY